jgi:sugar phosphate isomerase/epimerase
MLSFSPGDAPFMTLISMNEITTFRWSFEEDIENYQLAGYGAIGVWRQKLSDGDEDIAVERLLESGLTISNLMWAGGFTGSDGRSLEESIDDARQALQLAAALQAGCLVVYTGGRNNHTQRHAMRLLRTALDELLPLAEMFDVPLAIEPMHAACSAGWSFLTDLAPILDLIDEYQSAALKLSLDTYHFPVTGSQKRLLKQAAPHVAIVHLADRRNPPTLEHERCPLGRGTLPLANIVQTLQDGGYSGWYDVKLIGSEIESRDYWSLLEESHTAVAELTDASARTLA